MKNIFLSLLTCLIAASASAQNVIVRVGQSASVVAPIVPFSAAPGGAMLVSPLSGLGLSPTLSAPSLAASITPAPSALVTAPSALVAAPSAIAASVIPAAAISVALISPVAAAKGVPAAQGVNAALALSVLSAASSSDQQAPANGAKLDAMFDGSTARAEGAAAVAAPTLKPARSFLGRAALSAGVFLASSGIALAAAAPSIVAAGKMALVTDYAPLATAIAAVLGALFGLWSTRTKDGTSANAGHVFSATLSHGAIAGAAAYALIDLVKVAFLGASAAALAPLTAAVVTASLAQSAFAVKFTDPATTTADRVMGAFPAVAMAFGLGIGAVTLLAPAGALALSTAALMATGAATALYTALFRPEKSPAAGPDAMGRGFVLQTVMTGLALTLGPTPYGLFFFALGMWGFVSVMRTTAAEVWTAVPESFKNRFKR